MSGMMTKQYVRDTFLAGAFAAVPIVVTVILVKWVDDSTQVLCEPLFGRHVPLLGIAIAIVCVYLLGMAVRSFIGRQALRLGDALLLRMPLIRPVYEAWKQVSLTPGGKEGMYAKVLLAPAGPGGTMAVGFTSGDGVPSDPDLIPVFLPNSPNPLTGRLLFARRSEVHFLDMTAEEAMKLIVSNGNYVPAGLKSV